MKKKPIVSIALFSFVVLALLTAMTGPSLGVLAGQLEPDLNTLLGLLGRHGLMLDKIAGAGSYLFAPNPRWNQSHDPHPRP